MAPLLLCCTRTTENLTLLSYGAAASLLYYIIYKFHVPPQYGNPELPSAAPHAARPRRFWSHLVTQTL